MAFGCRWEVSQPVSSGFTRAPSSQNAYKTAAGAVVIVFLRVSLYIQSIKHPKTLAQSFCSVNSTLIKTGCYITALNPKP